MIAESIFVIVLTICYRKNLPDREVFQFFWWLAGLTTLATFGAYVIDGKDLVYASFAAALNLIVMIIAISVSPYLMRFLSLSLPRALLWSVFIVTAVFTIFRGTVYLIQLAAWMGIPLLVSMAVKPRRINLNDIESPAAKEVL